jgi:hypothetical protein
VKLPPSKTGQIKRKQPVLGETRRNRVQCRPFQGGEGGFSYLISTIVCQKAGVAFSHFRTKISSKKIGIFCRPIFPKYLPTQNFSQQNIS